ncbi:MAG: glutathione S-transferase family protein [Deltaproteobacteria bacterium]|nr:glutathione S-transferase family protein [Deltaproteobacteria bacterium]
MSQTNPVLTLYHGLASTCSKKVRLCLAEKGLEYESRLLNLQKFEQHEPEYLKLNPKGVVPTLVHNGNPICESTTIIDYLEEKFPEPPLTPENSANRERMRKWEKWSDEVGYAAVYVPTWDRLSRPVAEKLTDDELATVLQRIPTKERRNRWRQVARGGFSKAEMQIAYDKMKLTFQQMEEDLSSSDYLAGDGFSLAECAMLPFVERMVDLRPDLTATSVYPRVHLWLARLAQRPSWQAAFFFQGMDARTGAVLVRIKAEI